MFDLFAQACAASPARAALVTATLRLSYAELAQRVLRCAGELERQACGPLVAFELARPQAVVLMLACLKAGKTFLPIDAGTAPAVRDQMLGSVACDTLVEQLDMDSGAPSLRQLVPAVASTARPDPARFDGVMSLMFTSGSTGRPKAVMVRAASVRNLLHAPDFFTLRPEDVFATYSPLSFDASTFEIFTPLLNGNTLVVLDKNEVLAASALAAAVRREGISVLWLTAGLFQAMVLAGQCAGLAGLRTLLVGGDKVDWHAARRFLALAPQVALYNGYGPTENTVFTTVARLDVAVLDGAPGVVPIGRPVRGVQCVLRDDSGELLSGPASGRLLVGGAGLAAGYVGTTGNEAFLDHPQAVGGRFYDTGDQVRRDGAGTYYFIGRQDAQVKLNGHRVDLNGIAQRCIEAGLAPRVIAWYHAALGGLVLACADCGPDRVTVADARIDAVLSAWERPKRIVNLAEWTLNANGKTDAAALRARAEALISAAPVAGDDAAAAADPLVALAEQLLGVRIQDRRAKLFALGFDSVSMLGLQAGLNERFGADLDLLDIYEAASLAGIEELLRDRCCI
ncbi:non-ribosomal peptide synthetase [Massilia sp. YMA4]|uniref:non-ribosomal peptide synthetase n=1 Tax=Massilia sp. YMA4 TaxID=1593482 RepID=UPI000DD1463E|nr:non-ribosomal peptide synthetase [Massilia sp. YMA4]AXA92284.1 hypothetical protein DPH57_14715 [Massilia sp. YMA4]